MVQIQNRSAVSDWVGEGTCATAATESFSGLLSLTSCPRRLHSYPSGDVLVAFHLVFHIHLRTGPNLTFLYSVGAHDETDGLLFFADGLGDNQI